MIYMEGVGGSRSNDNQRNQAESSGPCVSDNRVFVLFFSIYYRLVAAVTAGMLPPELGYLMA